MGRLTRAYLTVLGVFLFAGSVYAADLSAGTYYTKVNIWYEDPLKIPSTNYHRGAVIPFGSKVKIISKVKERIQFTVDDEPGVTFTLVNVRKHSLVDGAELFKEYFAQDDPKLTKEFNNFNGKERRNIEKGTLEEGMSREAAIAAYGYPPKHKTPTLKSSLWTYWDARSIRRLVTFKNDRIDKIEEFNEFEEGSGPRWYHYVP